MVLSQIWALKETAHGQNLIPILVLNPNLGFFWAGFGRTGSLRDPWALYLQHQRDFDLCMARRSDLLVCLKNPHRAMGALWGLLR